MALNHAIFKYSGNFDNNLKIKSDLVSICAKHHLNVLNISDHSFWPEGYTAVFLLAESHLSFHSFPEQNLAYLDLFTCSNTIDPHKVLTDLAEIMEAKIEYQALLERD